MSRPRTPSPRAYFSPDKGGADEQDNAVRSDRDLERTDRLRGCTGRSVVDQPMTLADFLLARIAEDEDLARESFYEGQRWYAEEESVQSYPGADDDDRVWVSDRKRDSHHVVNWQPARVLAECEAKRQIVRQFTDRRWNPSYAARDVLLELLALPYADHPDYRDEWRPAS